MASAYMAAILTHYKYNRSFHRHTSNVSQQSQGPGTNYGVTALLQLLPQDLGTGYPFIFGTFTNIALINNNKHINK